MIDELLFTQILNGFIDTARRSLYDFNLNWIYLLSLLSIWRTPIFSDGRTTYIVNGLYVGMMHCSRRDIQIQYQSDETMHSAHSMCVCAIVQHIELVHASIAHPFV